MKKQIGLYVALIVFSLMMVWVDQSAMFSYFERSAIKVTLFGLLPFIVLVLSRHKFVLFDKGKYLKIIFLISGVVMVMLFLAFLLLYPYGMFDFVGDSLATKVGVTTSNYPLVFVYIVFINGPLEEFYFRYVMQLPQFSISRNFKIGLSSLFFALYHVGMLYTMFPWYLFVFAIVSLIGVGVFFSWVNHYHKGITYSVVLHMAANLTINTIGAFLLYNL